MFDNRKSSFVKNKGKENMTTSEDFRRERFNRDMKKYVAGNFQCLHTYTMSCDDRGFDLKFKVTSR